MERLEDLKYGRQQAMVMDFLYETKGTEAKGPIQIVPLAHVWQECWMAFVPISVPEVGSDKVERIALLIGYRAGYMRILAIGFCCGFYKNGNMKTVGFDNIGDILYGFFSKENLKDYCYHSPLTCMGNACNSPASNCVECNAS